MNDLYEIISQIQKDLYCPVCGTTFDIGEIRIRGFFANLIIIQTICKKGHLTLFATNYKKQKMALTENDVTAIHGKLSNFDGDFIKQWQH